MTSNAALLAFSAAVVGLPLWSANDSLPQQAASILEKRCNSCHGETTAMSGLKLTARERMLKGGTRGPALKPGNPADSLLRPKTLPGKCRTGICS